MKGHQHMTKEEVEQLLKRFMDGTSTLEEEAQLAEFFRSHEVVGEWKEYKEMFALFDEGKVEPPSPQRGRAFAVGTQESASRQPSPFGGRGTIIAAMMLLLLGLGFYFSSRIEKKPELVAQTDTIKTAPKREEGQGARSKEQGARGEEPETKQKPVEKVDTVRKVKEMQRIARPPKQYMAKVKKEDVQPKKEVLPDTIIFTAPPYRIAAETLSEPEIHVRPLRASAPQQQIDYEHLDYEEMKREIQLRGERLRDIGELAINDEEDF